MDHLEIGLSGALVTLIWIIQVLHYPFFRYLKDSAFSEAMNFHQAAMSYLAAPLMILELAVSGARVYMERPYSVLIFTIVLLIWGSTFLIQVPLHKRLLVKRDREVIDRLIGTNWIRTLLWTLKAVIVAITFDPVL